jgi:hypothetical protein
MSLRAAIVIATACAVSGCGSEDTAQPAAESQAAPRRETVFDPLTSTIDRAEGVQQTIDSQAAEQRRRIEEASR